MKDDLFIVKNQVSDWNLWLQTQNQMFLGWYSHYLDDGESKGKNLLFKFQPEAIKYRY